MTPNFVVSFHGRHRDNFFHSLFHFWRCVFVISYLFFFHFFPLSFFFLFVPFFHFLSYCPFFLSYFLSYDFVQYCCNNNDTAHTAQAQKWSHCTPVPSGETSSVMKSTYLMKSLITPNHVTVPCFAFAHSFQHSVMHPTNR